MHRMCVRRLVRAGEPRRPRASWRRGGCQRHGDHSDHTARAGACAGSAFKLWLVGWSNSLVSNSSFTPKYGSDDWTLRLSSKKHFVRPLGSEATVCTESLSIARLAPMVGAAPGVDWTVPQTKIGRSRLAGLATHQAVALLGDWAPTRILLSHHHPAALAQLLQQQLQHACMGVVRTSTPGGDREAGGRD